MPEVSWRVCWESELTDADHAVVSALLARCYPRWAATFAGGRSWSGARPEVRVLGGNGLEPVAHLGVLRRFLRAPNSERHVLVGDVGLVAVDPNLQRRGVGIHLLEQTQQLLRQLQLPFGFLTCRPEVVPFYQAGGWHRIEQQVTRMIGNDQAVETYHGGAMIMPVHATLGAWPTELVDRNGLEV